MADKIKAARARSRAAGSTKKQDRSSRFLGEHMTVIYNGDKEKEEQLKQLLIDKARMTMGQSGG
jgi:hypothetical protein